MNRRTHSVGYPRNRTPLGHEKETLTRYNMNPEDAMRSDTSQAQKAQYCMIPLTGGPQSDQSQRQKIEQWLLGAGGEEWGV